MPLADARKTPQYLWALEHTQLNATMQRASDACRPLADRAVVGPSACAYADAQLLLRHDHLTPAFCPDVLVSLAGCVFQKPCTAVLPAHDMTVGHVGLLMDK